MIFHSKNGSLSFFNVYLDSSSFIFLSFNKSNIFLPSYDVQIKYPLFFVHSIIFEIKFDNVVTSLKK